MKHLLILASLLFIGCAVDTGTSVSTNSNETPITPDIYSSSSITYISEFPTDLSYIGLIKHSTGAKLVMKNNTPYTMSIKVNYTISCSKNGGSPETKTGTTGFYFDMYEQKESSIYVDYCGIKTLECSGTILSIIPDSWGDDSNFKAWSGAYPISTN
ncbi:MAG: hypothetical protein IKN15_04805 [Bacteroidaceae bacterium]|nr:hypothetical protein [Bacteroidaceae bacterium]